MMTSSEWATAPISLLNARGANLARFTLPGPADTLAHTVTVGPIAAGMTLAPLQPDADADPDQSR
jgi:hypothetical protein